MNNGNSFFVTIEGIDGSGKSMAVDAINKEFKQVMITQEPSSSWTGDYVRKCINSDDTPALTDFYAFMSDRVNHIENTIKPALNRDQIVVCDRFTDSTRAYQYVALKNLLNSRKNKTDQYMEKLMSPWNIEPDLTLYMDISVDESLNRCDGKDKYEKREFLEAVNDRYEHLKNEYADRYYVIDASQSKEDVKDQVLTVMKCYINARKNGGEVPGTIGRYI